MLTENRAHLSMKEYKLLFDESSKYNVINMLLIFI